MEERHPILVLRTDGAGYNLIGVTEDGNTSQAPEEEQLIRWKIALGHHLKFQLAPPEDEREYVLGELPQGYQLISRRPNKADAKAPHYLHGHPFSESTKYRTPAEFVPHLLWLVSGSTDRNDCSCEFCKKMMAAGGLSVARQAGSVPVSQAPSPVTQGQTPGQPSAQANTPGQRQSTVQSTAPATSSAAHQAPGPAHTRAPAPTQAPERQHTGTPVQGLQPGSQAQITNYPASMPQQRGFSQAGTSAGNIISTAASTSLPAAAPSLRTTAQVFRIGELVWCRHVAWRLGVITSIETSVPNARIEDVPDDQCIFTLAPLGHRALQQQPTTKRVDELRPFLTFSVPATTIEYMQGKSFLDINWVALAQNSEAATPDPAQRARKKEMIGLEASKMAARFINDAFSTFNRIQSSPTSFLGMFLGAEQVRVGDPVRVVAPDAMGSDGAASGKPQTTTVMLVAEIRATPDATGALVLQIIGDVYQPKRVAAPDAGQYPPAAQLGPAFAEEMAFRNQFPGGGSDSTTPAGADTQWVWVPVEHGATRDETGILGRF